MNTQYRSDSGNLFSFNVPQHVAIIMDGNGRWAKSRGLPRSLGHKRGAESVHRAIEAAADMGVRYLTLFGFSSENWCRPREEINELMHLLRYYLRSKTAELHKNNITLRVIGDRTAFDDDIVSLINQAEELTAENDLMTVTIALNYGGRMDVVHAAYDLINHYRHSDDLPSLDDVEKAFPSFLMTKGLPDPDLLIRTSGEKRISNFLLWQTAYTEFVFLPVLWPDFDRTHLESAFKEYTQRERRFGDVQGAQSTVGKFSSS